MGSLQAVSIFRQLFPRCCTCSPCKSIPRPAPRYPLSQPILRRQVGSYSRLRQDAEKKAGAPSWKPKKSHITESQLQEFSEYDHTTADELLAKGRRPRRTKMLMRDFLEDSLYNPVYGYFTSQAVIFESGSPFDFPSLNSEAHFNNLLAERYMTFEDALDRHTPNDTRQLWHTPTELFCPHYAEAMARYLVSNYRISLYPYRDLLIYELGAGNATFMVNVMDYIHDIDPEVYARTQYNIVEISPSLAQRQAEHLHRTNHADKVSIINESIFAWTTHVPSSCFFIALEVIDNFAHDVVRYRQDTSLRAPDRPDQPMQGSVAIDKAGDFHELYSRDIDPVCARYLRVRNAACRRPYQSPLSDQIREKNRPSALKRLTGRMRGEETLLSEAEWLPTRLMQFFEILQRYFPAHRLLLSDFHYLPDTVVDVAAGRQSGGVLGWGDRPYGGSSLGAPVVQTRFQRQTVPVSTPMVRQGYFDIFFPTDFAVMEDVYRAITGRLTWVMPHADFMRRWADLEMSRTQNGEVPLLGWYRNASVMMTM